MKFGITAINKMDRGYGIILLLIGLALVFSISMNAEAQQGCCSWHDGISHCNTCVGKYVCNDGTYSPTCTCSYLPETCETSTIDTTTTTTSTTSTSSTTTILSENLIVHFIDVGQGDAILLEKGDIFFLIDCGSSDSRISEYLTSIGVSSIGYLMTTHPDADHIGGCDYVIENFDVVSVRDNGQNHTTQTYQDYITLAQQKDYVVVSDSYSILWDGVDIDILWPDEPYPTGDKNTNSIVAKVSYGSIDFMMTGDCDTDCESQLSGNLSSEILKVGHHGSSSSTPQSFLDAVSPNIGVISVGATNPYGHPTQEVLDRLNSNGIEIHRTDLEGNILITTDGATYQLTTDSTTTSTSSTTSTSTTTTSTTTTVPPAAYYCSSCSDCEDNINSASAGDTVYLTTDITSSGNCIEFDNVDGVTFDCQRNNIVGDSESYGIYLDNSSDNTIKNCDISLFYYGVYLSSSISNTLIGNTANYNSYVGFYIKSDHNALNNNTANHNLFGIYLNYPSSNNTLNNNTADINDYGIEIQSSDDNILNQNTANYNKYSGIKLYLGADNNILNQNTANYNKKYGFHLVSSSWVEPKQNSLNHNTANYNEDHGIYLTGADYNTLNNNTANNNYEQGIYLYDADYNTLSNNTANDNYKGIYLSSADHNTLDNNIACNSTYYYDIDLGYSSFGNSGDGNTCDSAYNWDDTGTADCSYSCPTTTTTSTTTLSTTTIPPCSSSPSQYLTSGDNTIDFQTLHSYSNYMDCYSNIYTCPSGYYAKTYVKYDTESFFDKFYVYNADTNDYSYWSGNSGGYVWKESDYESIKFRFTSDGSITDWGVDVDEVNCYSTTTTSTTTTVPVSCHTGQVGGWNYCSASCPCFAREGDCDSDLECTNGTICVQDVGANYGWDGSVDACEQVTTTSTTISTSTSTTLTISPQPVPEGYIGYAMLNGNVTSSGTSINVKVNGTSETVGSATTEDGGAFSLDVIFDNPDTVQDEGADENDPLTWYIDGNECTTPAPGSDTANSGYHNLNFVIQAEQVISTTTISTTSTSTISTTTTSTSTTTTTIVPVLEVIRNLPSMAGPDRNMTVTLSFIILNESAKPNSVIIREYVPLGWNMSSSEPAADDFNFEEGVVRWFLYGDSIYTRDIAYTLQVPSNATGTAEFSGEILYNDLEGNPVMLDIEGNISIVVGYIADTDGDGQVDDFELLSFIELWVQELVNDFDLLNAVDQWVSG